jgi:diaminohydroxyphosphoribosylaminopyrimidine deaminase/5-amino-6-(5-phosphoribosylamino)uracil reductase
MIPAILPASGPEVLLEDERFMRLALALGERNLGLTWPNPAVGAVVVAEGAHGPMIVGQGATQAGGRPHAERVALDMAGDAARGATLYVTLEPCSARSRQDHGPSCTDLVLQSGIRRLVIGAPDPSPFAHGAGFPRLEAAGVTVVQGVLAEDACRAHRGHVLRVTEGRPLLTLKFARTADGFAARRNGPRLMISGEASNARTHLLRARHDVIMVGVGTILADDPVLTVRIAGLEHRSPIRVVLDSDLRTPISSRLVSGARSVPVWIVAGEHAPLEPEAALKAAGVEVMRVAETGGRVDVTEALRLLASRGVTRIFSEGGPALGEALVEADLIDTLALATSRTALGEEGVPALGPSLAAALATRFTPLSREDLGTDVLEIFERAR